MRITMEALDQAQNGTVSHDAENQAQRPRSVDTHVLSSRRFCSRDACSLQWASYAYKERVAAKEALHSADYRSGYKSQVQLSGPMKAIGHRASGKRWGATLESEIKVAV